MDADIGNTADTGPRSSPAATATRVLSLRWRLALLVVASIVPLLAFAVGYEYVQYRQSVAATSQQTSELARSMALFIDEKLQSQIEALKALAVSRALTDGDFEAFRGNALAVAEQFPGGNIVLLRPDGQQLVNTVLPQGAPLPVRRDMESTKEAFAIGRPTVSNFYRSAVNGRPVVAIDVPVRGSDGNIAYVVSLNPALNSFAEAIADQHLPSNRLVGLFDRRGVTIARAPDGERYVGEPAAPALIGPLQAHREGYVENISREGIPVFTAFSHGPRFGWAVAVGVPRTELTEPAFAAALRTLVVGGFVLAAALAMALFAARRIAGPIESLRRLAADMDRDALREPVTTGLPETDEVARALRTAEEDRRRSRRAEIVLRDAIETIPAAFAIYDDEDRLFMCNRSYKELFPGDEAEIVPGIRFDELLKSRLATGKYRSVAGHEDEWLAERLRQHRGSEGIVEQRFEDGRWVLAATQHISNDWTASLRIDITTLKLTQDALSKSEERFRLVVESVPNAIVMINRNGRIEMVNAEAEKMFGYERADLLGKPVETLLPPRYHLHHPQLWRSFLADPEARPMGAGRDFYAARKDGSEFPVEIGLSPIDTEDGTMVLSSIIDITARRAAERMRAYHAAIIESTADAIIAKDLNGIVTSWNQAAEAIFGYSAGEMIGEPITCLLPSERLGEEDAILNEIRRGGRVDNFETVRRRKDGTQLPVSLTISPILGPGGQIIGASKIARDISERLQSEQQLRRERDTAQRYLDVADVMILVLDTRANVKLINQKGCQVLGHDGPAGIVGKAWLDHFVPQRVRGTLKVAFDDLIRGNLTHIEKYTNPVVTRTGEERLIAWHNSFLTDSEGRITASVSSGEDITDRMQMEADLRTSEDRFRSIFAAVSEGIFIISPETGSFTDVNKAGSAMFGYTADEIVGTAVGELSSGIPPYTQHEVVGLIERAKTSGRPQRFEWQFKTKDGHLFPAEISIGLASISGETVVLAAVRDVTERQTVEAQLRQAQKMEAIGNLTGGMAHDFNNLLGIIVGNLGFARSRIKDDEVQEVVGEALEAAWRGADLTRRLLAFARRQPLRPAPIDLNTLVPDTVRLLRRLLGDDIEVSLNLGVEVWPVMADPAQLEASLTNLATNARDAMPQGGSLIITTANRHLDEDYAKLHADVAPGDYAMIEVSDTGLGMSSDILNQIFEPFFTTKEPGKGTGLGLSMVFGFVRQSGGHVNVYSEPGAGTTFRLYLPRVTADAPASEVADVSNAVQGAGETVLVVEDNLAMRRVVVRQLSELGYRVIECDSAAAALQILQDKAVDLLFTDIVMPGGLDGIGLAGIVLERWPRIKVVLTSGFPQARLDRRGENLASAPLLSKPYSREELAGALRIALNA